MLALAPKSVPLDRAAAGPATPPGPGPMQHADPRSPNYSRSGCICDPTAAPRNKGEAMLSCMVQDMIQMVEDWV